MRAKKIVLILIIVTCLVFLAIMGIPPLFQIEPVYTHTFSAQPGKPAAPSPTPNLVGMHLDTADLNTLDTLPGVGPATAGNFIEYFSSGGKLYFPEDLMNIKGIGEKKLQQILPLVVIPWPTPAPLTPLFP